MVMLPVNGTVMTDWLVLMLLAETSRFLSFVPAKTGLTASIWRFSSGSTIMDRWGCADCGAVFSLRRNLRARRESMGSSPKRFL